MTLFASLIICPQILLLYSDYKQFLKFSPHLGNKQ